MAKHEIWRSWTWIRQIRSNPRTRDYPWAHQLPADHIEDFDSWRAFIHSEVGLKPSAQHKLHRLDQTQGWVHGNLTWATQKQIGNNMPKRNIMIEYQGQTRTLKEWCEQLNLEYDRMFGRLRRGWSIEQAFSLPRNKKRPRDA
jgi:hypothetical protein